MRVVAQNANVIARWCGVRDLSALTCEALRSEVGLASGAADLFVLFGGGVVGSLQTLVAAMREGVARRYAIVGGRGHATYWLDRAFAAELEVGHIPDLGVVAGESSEAEMLDALLSVHYGLHADLLETRSTNCGNNISNLLDLLEAEGALEAVQGVPTSVILCQDAVMQRRMDATWQRQVQDRPRFARTQIINWAAYEAELADKNGQLAWAAAPEGIWPIDAYLQLLQGEVMRLHDDEHGYGPRGRDFVAHVDVPSHVLEAARALDELVGDAGRPPDERYA